MTPFRDLPIRRKLLLLTLAPTVTALLLASIGFLVWDIVDSTPRDQGRRRGRGPGTARQPVGVNHL